MFPSGNLNQRPNLQANSASFIGFRQLKNILVSSDNINTTSYFPCFKRLMAIFQRYLKYPHQKGNYHTIKKKQQQSLSLPESSQPTHNIKQQQQQQTQTYTKNKNIQQLIKHWQTSRNYSFMGKNQCAKYSQLNNQQQFLAEFIVICYMLKECQLKNNRKLTLKECLGQLNGYLEEKINQLSLFKQNNKVNIQGQLSGQFLQNKIKNEGNIIFSVHQEKLISLLQSKLTQHSPMGWYQKKYNKNQKQTLSKQQTHEKQTEEGQFNKEELNYKFVKIESEQSSYCFTAQYQ